MREFIARYADRVVGVLSGFDRLVFRGTLRQLSHQSGLHSVLATESVLLKEFGDWAHGLTERVKQAAYGAMERWGRPVIYVRSSSERKEDRAREVRERDGVECGPICLLTAVEPCQSFEIHRSKERRLLELEPRQRKCLHLYLYLVHEQFGFCHVRLQTWLPFQVQICLNGREWLARQMDAAGLGYQRADNTFLQLDAPDAAQRLLHDQLATAWPAALDALTRLVHPLHHRLLEICRIPYYWTTHQMEWATDLLFRRATDLTALYPRLVRHALCHLKSEDVLRFLGKKLSARFAGEVTSDCRRRTEGVRVKHSVNQNSVKVYDKAPSVLRVETTLHAVRDLRAYRPTGRDQSGPCAWQPMRKGIADLHRCAQLSQASNDRYLDALAAVDPDDTTSLEHALSSILRPVRWKKKRARALRPLHQDDASLLEAVADGAFLIKGFRNRDLVARLFGRKRRPLALRRRLSAQVTRRIRLLRAHGLVRKIPGTHRYLLNDKGRRICTAVLAARQTPLHQLTNGMAA